ALLLAATTVQRAGLARLYKPAGSRLDHLWRGHGRLGAGGVRTNLSRDQRLGIRPPALGNETRMVPGPGAHGRAGRALLRRPSMVRSQTGVQGGVGGVNPAHRAVVSLGRPADVARMGS